MSDLGCVKDFVFEVELTNNDPVSAPPIRYTPK